MGFETFNDPALNVNLEKVVREELSKPDMEKAVKAKEDLERAANFEAIDKNFGIDANGEKKNDNEDILLEQKLKFRVTNAINGLKALEEGDLGSDDSKRRARELKEMLQEAEEDLREFYERTLN